MPDTTQLSAKRRNHLERDEHALGDPRWPHFVEGVCFGCGKEICENPHPNEGTRCLRAAGHESPHRNWSKPELGEW